MSNNGTVQRFRCRILALMTLAALASSCGLNQRDKAVADTNAQIERVYEQSEFLARAIYDLPDQPDGPESFGRLLAAYQDYRQEVNRLNVMIRRLSGVVPELTEHLRDQFDPEATESLERCDSAVLVFQQTEVGEAEYQQALTAVCLCVERYAAAVTAVSQEYARLVG